MRILLLCFFLFVAQTHGDNETSTAQTTDSRTQISPKTIPNGESPSSEAGKNAPEQQTDIRKPNHIVVDNLPFVSALKDIWDKISVICTIALVLVGIGTLIFIAIQTRVAADAAKSAKGGIDALVAENRPWMILSRETKMPTSPPNDWTFPVIIRNYGKTPARITSYQVETVLGANATDAPDPSIYTKIDTFQPFLLPQGEMLDAIKRLPTPWASADIMAETKFLWLCGFVQYSDTFDRPGSPPYETSFCLVYRLPRGINRGRWARSGRREFNRAI